MQEKPMQITFSYDADLIQYLKIHGIDHVFEENTDIKIEFTKPKYLWMIAQNYGRYKEIKEMEKIIKNKNNNL